MTLGGSAGSAETIGSTSVRNIELCREGIATLLKAGTNLNGTVIGIMGVNGWNIHGLQIECNRSNRSGAGTNPELMG